MFRITNDPRPYAWGSRAAIAELRGVEPSGEPEAELWFGTHSGSPARIVAAEGARAPRTLAEAVAAEGGDGHLPYLLKLLAAASPLSLQAHPTAEQAQRGFEREEAAGIPVDAPHRNYRDRSPKPEVILAVSERFEALCGFREPAESAAAIRELADGDPALEDLAARVEGGPLRDVFEWLITRGEGVQELVATAQRLAKARDGAAADTVRMLAAEYPADPGVVIALLLNRVELRRGEALFLPAGNIHAYLHGMGVELMTASDNVLRGGLTPKHVDVAELLSVLDFTPGSPPRIVPEQIDAGVDAFRPEGVDFELVRVRGGGTFVATGGSIALCIRGNAELRTDVTELPLSQGEAVYISRGESARVQAAPHGEIVVASQR
ncbi:MULTISPECIES: mannose-6-phosphate isomerase, class I [unclassified Salinibacterium]|uniref:mannose-6-phosphate isomerase, class I n=1 Tax=unclassified Salinibacterium TaxID=2632331 RepID=UPI00143CF021|nr:MULTISPECIES: mannose-6-phosphate isomerase, class I [unclassified Salinibacterium]